MNALVRIVAGAMGMAVLSGGGAGWAFGTAAGAALLAALFTAAYGNLSRKTPA
ncbi:hypothetical protein [Planomonospora sp. ID82291]|uniref:hypothetical protein n=1 Tax=Planomonospora sp. ID82291 TaxID=2738136 RepID=UPI001E5A4CAE|nr:hypothetical protein [Planomonospora sp. ID82291]